MLHKCKKLLKSGQTQYRHHATIALVYIIPKKEKTTSLFSKNIKRPSEGSITADTGEMNMHFTQGMHESAAGLFKYVCPFSGHQALKG